MDYKELLKLAITAAFKAGEEILKIYNTDFYVETKSDNTPVTLADRTSGEYITKILSITGSTDEVGSMELTVTGKGLKTGKTTIKTEK